MEQSFSGSFDSPSAALLPRASLRMTDVKVCLKTQNHALTNKDQSNISDYQNESVFNTSGRRTARNQFPHAHPLYGTEKIPVPPVTEIGGLRGRIWNERHIERVRKLLPKIANGRKTRYKKQSAVSTQQSAKTKKTQARVPAPHKKK